MLHASVTATTDVAPKCDSPNLLVREFKEDGAPLTVEYCPWPDDKDNLQSLDYCPKVLTGYVGE